MAVPKVGDRIPGDIFFGILNEGEEKPQKITTDEVFKGKKVVLFGIPGTYSVSSKFLLFRIINLSIINRFSFNN
jgi:peroxiredoxin